ncbi:FAD-dependent monooxygenase [Nocardia terpenica]|uniref:2,4-dichlorophenol 6-monooxygenase n=1 Tax=Nocardia terpenica TaxID=455432 RepID=A0A161XGT8_9NOCA|nr:FAD-dependent monooxygenase [Nocardia terpenica]KZM72708.1 2,4-dichlorophenol 6-monooxygenase [Nocardia terpenica]NQE92387.1 SnoaL-like domain-containing protein [Nocardia terpenica]
MTETTIETTPVLIVGGSLVGLSAAVFLAWRGIPAMVVERHAGSSVHPRAIGYTTRTLELFRATGVELPPSEHGSKPPRRARVESLAGTWFQEYPWTPPSTTNGPAIEYSPVHATAIAQDRLEPILRQRAVELGAQLRPSTEMIGFGQDADGVTATLRRRDDGSEYQVRAQYLVAADGATSPIRNALGIGRSGEGLLSVQRSILFRAPLEEYLAKGIVQFEIEQDDFTPFLITYSDGRWVLMLDDDLDRDEAAQRAAIERAIGRSDLPIDVIAGGRWELAALIADRYSAGRVFLAGDAAHQLPPNRGGFGANTGIDDAHNLAWKLAAVLSGESTPGLLETYSAERRPIALLRHEQLFARADYKAFLKTPKSDVPVLPEDAIELGQLYRSAAVLGAGAELPAALRPDEWAGQPGTRAPHLRILVDGTEESTLDLFQRGWVLVSEDDHWTEPVAAAIRATGVTVRLVLIGVDAKAVDPRPFGATYGVHDSGATLVRPDGYIAWRAVDAPADPARALADALGRAADSIRTARPPQSTLEQRIQRLEDSEEIRTLTARYAHAVNQGWDGKTLDVQTIPEIFAPDASWEGTHYHAIRGAGAIAAALPEATSAIEAALHSFMNPIVTVSGDTATGQWQFWVASAMDGEFGAAFMNSRLTYTRTAAGWRIQTVREGQARRGRFA